MSYSSQLSENMVFTIVNHIYQSTPANYVVDEICPLLSVSRIWRKAVQSVLTHTCIVNEVDYGSSFYIWENMLSANLKYIPGRDELFENVRNVVKIVSIENVLRNNSDSSNLVFPYADCLQLEIYQPESNTHDSFYSFDLADNYWLTTPGYLRESTLLFVDNVKSMVPNAKSISIKFGNNLCTYIPNYEDITGTILRLFDEAHSRSLAVHQKSISIELIDSAICLTTLELDWFENNGIAERIIRNNAGTLESLRINMSNTTVSRIWKIVECDAQLIYQNLHSVHVHVEDIDNGCDLHCSFSLDYVPFPRLCNLIVDTDYSYAAEMFIRGSVKTIEYLSLNFNDELVHTLTDLYSDCDQPALRKVLLHPPSHTHHISNRLHHDNIYCGMMTRFLRVLPKNLLALRLPEDTLDNRCVLDKVMEKFTKLQILQVDDAKMYISQVCKLASMLPSLRKLYIRNLEIDTRFKGSDLKDIAMTLGSEYQMADSRLEYVELLADVIFSFNADAFLHDIAGCSSVLMQLCSQFKRLKVCEDFQDKIDELASSLATNFCI